MEQPPSQGEAVSKQAAVNNEFSIIADYKKDGHGVVLTFVASDIREKQLWCSDILQCLEKIRFDEIVRETKRYAQPRGSSARHSNVPEVTLGSQKGAKSSIASKSGGKKVMGQVDLC